MDMFEMLMAKSLSGGGGAAPTLITKNITANGSYVASDDDADGYSEVTVNVPTGGHSVIVTTLPNAVVTISDSSNTYTKTADVNGIASFTGIVAGTYTVTATLDGGQIGSTSLTVTDFIVSSLPFVTRQVDFTNNTSPVAPSAADLAASPVYSGITRCNVADDGTILAYPGDSGYTEDGSNGQVMVKIPKFWYKLETEATSGSDIEVGQWYISDKAVTGYKLHPAFINANGDEVDYFLIGAFENTFQDGSSYTETYDSSYKMASVGSNGGTSIKPGNAFSRAQGRSAAAARGTGWYQIAFTQIQAVQMLFVVENGFNSQYSVGQSYTYSSNSATINVGQTPSTGNYGDTTTGGSGKGDTKPVSWRGIENLWGNTWSWIDGCVGLSGYIYYTTGYTYSDSASGYVQVPWKFGGITSPGGGYATNFGYDSSNPWLIVPSASTSTYDASGVIGDRIYNSNMNRDHMCYHGGRYNFGSNAGLFNVTLNAEPPYKSSDTSSRLMYVPTT